MPDQPGWYPDPARPDQARWHDGSSWTSHVRPGTPPPVDVQEHGPVQTAPPEPKHSVYALNVWSTFSLVASAGYVLTFIYGGVFVLGLLPIGLAVAGYKRHERLAVPALVTGIAVFVLNLWLSFA